jgi:hypothetical protein
MTITTQVNKNSHYIQPKVPAGDNGYMLRVQLEAPGTIDDITYACEGTACGWVHQCPDSCGGSYPSTYVKDSPSSWSWYGWSNSGADCVLIFTIQYH